MADLPELPDDGVIEVGRFLRRCGRCNLPLPVTVNAFIATDDDGDLCMFTEVVSLDLELHALTHEGIEYEVVPEDG